ncbi:MAG: hypothetical protein RR276_02510 [Angelakisella sp.]
MTRRGYAVGLLVLAGLLALFCLVLPPRQTADFAAFIVAVLAHLATLWLLEWLLHCPRGLLVTVGGMVTGVLYWLAAVGTALLFRLLGLTATGLLAGLELLYAVLAAVCCCAFWFARGYDPTTQRKEDFHDQG